MIRRVRHLAIVVHLALVSAVACKQAPPDATIKVVNGAATLRKHGEGKTLAALVGGNLYEADVVATGSDGSMTLGFAGGNTLTLNADTTVVIRRGGATGAELGAVVIAGSARAASPGSTTRLVIGSPFGMAEIGAGELVVDVDLTKGITVLVGEVSVMKDGESKTIDAGQILAIDGLVVPVGDKPPTPDVEVSGLSVNLEPTNAVLIANPKMVQIKRAGSNDWTPAQARDTLRAGDSVRTKKVRGTQIKFDDDSEVTLGQNSEMHFDEAKAGAKAARARYAITAGTAEIHLTKRQGKDEDHEIAVAGLGVQVRPGDREAEVGVHNLPQGAVEVAARFGQVHLSDGTDLDAGNAVTVKDGKVASEVRPVVPTDVELRAGTTSVLYYQGGIPPVAFDWTSDSAKTASIYQITLASDKTFKDVVFSETVRKTGFVYDDMHAGRYYWRVKAGNDAPREGSILVQKGGDNDCANCKRVNIINDNGEKTVVYFQQALPALTFQWQPIDGAVQYRLRVFEDGAFDKPFMEATSETTKLAFQAGALEEGKYFWLVSAVDAGGKAIGAAGRTNGLEIAYDNVITDLVIRAPKSGQRVSGDRCTTVGELALGARLFINGKQADLDSKGRFKEAVALHGSDKLVYRTVAADGVQRFYVRDLRR